MVRNIDKLLVSLHDRLHQFTSRETQKFDEVIALLKKRKKDT